MSTEHPDLRTWLEERETIQDKVGFERIYDGIYAVPKLLAGVKAVLELHTRSVRWCGQCEDEWPCATVTALQEAINDD